MVMIDELVSATHDFAETLFSIRGNNIFVRDGVFSESGLLENIAQTAAAMIGYQCYLEKVPVPPGFIGSIKNLEVTNFPKPGQTIKTKIFLVNEVFGVSIVRGEVYLDAQCCASGEYKIFVLKDE